MITFHVTDQLLHWDFHHSKKCSVKSVTCVCTSEESVEEARALKFFTITINITAAIFNICAEYSRACCSFIGPLNRIIF